MPRRAAVDLALNVSPSSLMNFVMPPLNTTGNLSLNASDMDPFVSQLYQTYMTNVYQMSEGDNWGSSGPAAQMRMTLQMQVTMQMMQMAGQLKKKLPNIYPSAQVSLAQQIPGPFNISCLRLVINLAVASVCSNYRFDLADVATVAWFFQVHTA